MRDIKPRRTHKSLLDLKRGRRFFVPITSVLKGLFLVSIVLLFLIKPTAKAPIGGPTYAAEHDGETQVENVEEVTTAENSTTTRAELEARLEEINQQIKERQGVVSQLMRSEQTYENKLNQLRAEINSLTLQIESVELKLQKLNQDTAETQRRIDRTENQIAQHKEALASGMQALYETDNQTLLAMLLQNDRISDVFNNINNLLLVQNNVQSSLRGVINLRQELVQQKAELSRDREDVASLRALRERQRERLSDTEAEQKRLLSLTKQERAEEEQILQEQRQTAAEIRSRMLELVGGGELTFEEAYELAQFAEDITGTRSALIMAIVTRESELGRNTGTCNRVGDDLTWKDIMPGPEDNSWRDDQSIYLAITENLGISPDGTPLSCPIGGGWGGAMGASQFIPHTWATYGGYEEVNGEWQYNSEKDRIREITGSNGPSDPWNNRDAFLATGIYINELYESSTCQNYADRLDHRYPRQELLEECATSQYYAGGNWQEWYSYYGIPVVATADDIQQDINVLES